MKCYRLCSTVDHKANARETQWPRCVAESLPSRAAAPRSSVDDSKGGSMAVSTRISKGMTNLAAATRFRTGGMRSLVLSSEQ